MEHCTQEEADAAKRLLDFYVDLVENNGSSAKFYLAENVVLDWFGKTVKENKKVSLFIKDQVCKVTHHIASTVPSSKNVAFKDTHYVKVPNNQENVLVIPVAKNASTPSTSMLEKGQGDGVHNVPLLSPPKKMKFGEEAEATETVEGEAEITQLKYVTAEGSVEFHRPSIKKLQNETKWRRPVKLHLGYTTNGFKDCTIYLIIYEGNLKCRRNLYKEFCESSAKASV